MSLDEVKVLNKARIKKYCADSHRMQPGQYYETPCYECRNSSSILSANLVQVPIPGSNLKSLFFLILISLLLAGMLMYPKGLQGLNIHI